MTVYYVGKGGSDSNDGLSWANRKLTLNGAEDIPVAAGDTVYVGPGDYLEMLTCDVSGSSGNPIVYIGDYTGANTDGIGGIVRIASFVPLGNPTRQACVLATDKSYRTFRGFFMEDAQYLGSTDYVMQLYNPDNLIVEDCEFRNDAHPTEEGGIYISCDQSDILFTIRRCAFHGGNESCVRIENSNSSFNSASVIENCYFSPGWILDAGTGGRGLLLDGYGNFTIRNNLFYNALYAIEHTLTGSSSDAYAYNNIFMFCDIGILAGTHNSEVIEDYNTYIGTSPRTSNQTSPEGSNSDNNLFLPEPAVLLNGSILPYDYAAPSIWSQIRRIAGTSEASDDLYGFTRPTTSGKKSRGPIQFRPAVYSVEKIRNGFSSVKLDDAGVHPFYIPVNTSSTTVSVYVLRQKDYTGTAPQMIIREPGQSDRVTTDSGNDREWNLLSDTFTPSGNSDYVQILFRSNNTASSGKYIVYFADFDVS